MGAEGRIDLDGLAGADGIAAALERTKADHVRPVAETAAVLIRFALEKEGRTRRR